MLKMRVGGRRVVVVAMKKDHSNGTRKFEQRETDMQIIREQHQDTLSRNKWDEAVPKTSEECRVVSGVIHHDKYVQEAAFEKLLRISQDSDMWPDEKHKEADSILYALMTALGLRELAGLHEKISKEHWRGHIMEKEILCSE